jgi:hypothetical protein
MIKGTVGIVFSWLTPSPIPAEKTNVKVGKGSRDQLTPHDCPHACNQLYDPVLDAAVEILAEAALVRGWGETDCGGGRRVVSCANYFIDSSIQDGN